MPTEFLGPSATIFAALFGGSVGLWLGSRLQLGRFKNERAFERRVGWYEQMIRLVQQIRAIAWEIASTFSKISPKRYRQLSERIQELVREFDDLVAERHNAKQRTLAAIRELGLTKLSLEASIPGYDAGRKTTRFWEAQHSDWSKAFNTISEDLEEELFRKSRKLFRNPVAALRGTPKKRISAKVPPKPKWLALWKRRASLLSREASELSGPTAKNAQLDSLETQPELDLDLEERTTKAIFDTLWATMQMRAEAEATGNSGRATLANVVQCGILRVADLQSLVGQSSRLQGTKRAMEGWQRQHISRLMAMALLENADQFEYLLNSELREQVNKDGGDEKVRSFDELVKRLRAFKSQNAITLQPFRNTVIAGRYANANLDIQALRSVPSDEIRLLCLRQVGWITDLVNLVTQVLVERRRGAS